MKPRVQQLAQSGATGGQTIVWDVDLGQWVPGAASGGVTDHGALGGLTPDDDHTQYLRTADVLAGAGVTRTAPSRSVTLAVTYPVLVLNLADPVPGGTPANTVIVRKAT